MGDIKTLHLNRAVLQGNVDTMACKDVVYNGRATLVTTGLLRDEPTHPVWDDGAVDQVRERSPALKCKERPASRGK